jgi:hypothetical protein
LVSDDIFSKCVGDLITALKLIDDTQVDIRDELVTLNEMIEGLNDKLETIAEYLDANMKIQRGI